MLMIRKCLIFELTLPSSEVNETDLKFKILTLEFEEFLKSRILTKRYKLSYLPFTVGRPVVEKYFVEVLTS